VDLQIIREIEALKTDVARLRTIEQGQITSAGTTFPASPQTGQVVYRTDRNLLYVYDGTRWLTTTEEACPLWHDPITSLPTTTALAGAVELRADDSIWITRCCTGYLVNTTNDASNYWTIRYRALNDGYTAETGTIHTLTTASVAAGVWTKEDAAPNGDPGPSGTSRIDVRLTTTGTPGTLRILATLYYRRVG